MKKTEENRLFDRYTIAFEKVNGHKPYKLYYKKGWIYLQSKESSLPPNPYRLKTFKEMINRLESR